MDMGGKMLDRLCRWTNLDWALMFILKVAFNFFLYVLYIFKSERTLISIDEVSGHIYNLKM